MIDVVQRTKGLLKELVENGREALGRLARLEERMARIESETTFRLDSIQAQVAAAGAVRASVEHAARPREAVPFLDAAAGPDVEQRLYALAGLLRVRRASTAGKARVGNAHDGGYVMLDDWQGIAGAISIGIGGDDGWDAEVAGRGIPVAQFDHTIAEPPRRLPLLNWQPLGVAAQDVNTLRSLRSLIALAGLPGAGDLVLKMDAEGTEWEVLAAGEDAAPLGRFRQIVAEFHWFDRVGDDAWYRTARTALAHILATHACVHVHANNHGGVAMIRGVAFPRVLELTFARRDSYTFDDETALFPTALDAPCDPRRPDIYLGAFRFPEPTVSA